MSYTKTTWANGDTITSEKLNNAEDGIYKATPVVVPFVMTEVEGEPVVTTTAIYSDIVAAVQNGIPVEGELDAGGMIMKMLLTSYDPEYASMTFNCTLDMGTPGESTEITFYRLIYTSARIVPTIAALQTQS